MGVVVDEGGRGLLETGFGLALLGSLALHVTKFYYLKYNKRAWGEGKKGWHLFTCFYMKPTARQKTDNHNKKPFIPLHNNKH